MIKLSGVVITYNEEKHIEKCLKSLQHVVDDIIVIDSFSTDRTPEICLKYNVTFIQKEFLGYIEQKNFAVTQAKHDYILSLDGDESLSDNLIISIQKLKKCWTKDGYYLNRRNFFCNQWIHYGNLYPDKKIRLFDRRKGSWKGINPHDTFILNEKGATGRIHEDILHWTYDSYAKYNDKIGKFSTTASEAYFQKGIRAPLWKIIIKPFWGFFKSYILKFGFLDGFNGLVIGMGRGYITFLKYIKLRELWISKKSVQTKKKELIFKNIITSEI